MMDLPIPEAVEGTDRSDAAFNRPANEPDLVWGETKSIPCITFAAFMQGMGCTAKWEDGYEWRALRTKRYTYAVHRPDRSEKLFDNVADPFQTRNLIDEPESAKLRDQFRIVLQQRMNAINDTFEACTWYRDKWTEDRVILRTATLT